VVAAGGWRGPTSIVRRYLVPLASAVAAPLLYEVWRMAYFALVVSNTALAKSASASWWSQGFTYVWNFIAPYTLWLPFALAVPLVGLRIWRWARAHDRTGVVVALAPLVAATVDLLYVARVGGDYQHARLLLPAFMALCLPVTVVVRQLRSLMIVPVLGIVVWSVVCAGWLRFSTGGILLSDHGITDERAVWIAVSGTAHPITAVEYHNHLGGYYRSLAARAQIRGRKVMVVNTELLASRPASSPDLRPARTALPVSLVVNVGAIGVTGYLSGSNVYVFDDLSLANPIGSHVEVAHHRRPGHEKYLGPTWMIARFGTDRTVLPEGVTTSSVDAARTVLTCAPLHSYLEAITSPWGWSRAVSNITHALTFTTMTFSAQPRQAETELCH